MWLKIYKVASIIALLWFVKLQYYGQSLYSESPHSSHYYHSSGASHTFNHK